MKLKRILILLLFITLGVAAADAPTVSDHVRAKILKAQLDQSNIQGEVNQIQARMTVLQQNWAAAQASLDAAIEEAYREAKVDKKDWSFDRGKLEFVAVPKPPEKKP